MEISDAKRVRMARLRRGPRGAMFIVPLDHSLADGPIATAAELRRMTKIIADNGGDGIVVHKGRVRFLPVAALARLSVVLHVNGSTRLAPDGDAKVLVADVEAAVTAGADAVSVHINLGADTEAQQLRDLGRVADRCVRWGMPLLAMVYPRGPQIDDPTDPELVAHAATVAADLGADLVKVPFTGSVDAMADVVAGCPIPVLVAGGSPTATGTTEDLVRDSMAAGARGAAIGRGVFQAADPAEAVRRIASIVHAGHDSYDTDLSSHSEVGEPIT